MLESEEKSFFPPQRISLSFLIPIALIHDDNDDDDGGGRCEKPEVEKRKKNIFNWRRKVNKMKKRTALIYKKSIHENT